jgi:calpain-15
MLLNRELSYTEFKGFYECINRSLTEIEYKQKVLKRYCSTENGLSLKGFKDFFIDNIKSLGEEAIWGWLDSLGYDRELYSVRSRCFILTFHSETEISITVRDAIQTDLDARTNVQFIEKYGKELESKSGVKCFYYFSNKTHCYSYGIYNELPQAIEATLDCSGSSSMLFSSKYPVVKKRVEPGQMEFVMHAMAVPKVDNYVRTAKCTWHVV